MPRQRQPVRYRFFVKNANGDYVDMNTLSAEEQQRHRRGITDKMMAQFGFERDAHPEQPAREGEIKTEALKFLTDAYNPLRATEDARTAAGA